MLSAHCFQGWQRARLDWIGGSRAWLVEENQPAE
jgi:hypothetical protein